MAGTAISIDPAAGGVLRHRFVRAVTASAFVLLAGVSIWAYGASLPVSLNDPELRKGGLIGFALMSAVLLLVLALLVYLMFSLFVATLAAISSVFHRRLTALALLFVNLIMVGVAALLLVFVPLQEFGIMPRQPSAVEYAPWQNWSMLIVVLIAGAIAFEGAGWAWWQLRVGRAHYFAARGWRAPPWRIFSTMRQMLGLPAFISNFGQGRFILTFVYFLVAGLNIGLIGAIAVPFSIFMMDRGTDMTQPLLIGLGFAALLLLNAIGLGALLQNVAAAQATRLYQKAREWDARPPVLFLRAFNQDAEKLKARSRDPLVKFPAGCGEARTLDELLLESASVYGPVIAIGDPRDPTPPLGAARVFVQGEGNEWQHVVTQLLAASNAVVMCPSTSEGVKWELDLITDAVGRLRIIFLANPQLSPEDTRTLFERIAPHGEAPALAEGQTPIAAYMDAHNRWTVLTTKRPPCVQTYSVALNYALQASLGLKGVPLPKQRKRAA